MSVHTRQDHIRVQKMMRMMVLCMVCLAGCVAIPSRAVYGQAFVQTTAELRPQTPALHERPTLHSDGLPATHHESRWSWRNVFSFWTQYSVAVLRGVPTIIHDGIAQFASCLLHVDPCQSLAPVVVVEHQAGTERRDLEASQSFVVHTEDDIQATHDLILFLQKNGFDAQLYAQEFISVVYDGESFLMAPMVQRGELSRIIVAKTLDIKQEYRDTSEISSYITRLNKKVDFATFYLSEQYDRMIMQGNITFIDQLEEKEVRKFLEFFRSGFSFMLEALPETAKYFN